MRLFVLHIVTGALLFGYLTLVWLVVRGVRAKRPAEQRGRRGAASGIAFLTLNLITVGYAHLASGRLVFEEHGLLTLAVNALVVAVAGYTFSAMIATLNRSTST